MEYSNKALFVIDMQQDYVGIKSRYKYDSEKLIARINNRIQNAQNNKDLVVYIKNKKILKSGEYISDLVHGLDIVSENIFIKETSSFFSNNKIIEFLNQSNIREVETIGVDGNCCVASSAMDGVKAGFKVIFPCEYIGVLNKDRFLKKKQLLKNSGVMVLD